MEGRTTHNALLISSLFQPLTRLETRSTSDICWMSVGGFLRTLARTVVLTSTTPARSGPFPLPREIVLYSLHPRVQGIKDLLHAGLENPQRWKIIPSRNNLRSKFLHCTWTFQQPSTHHKFLLTEKREFGSITPDSPTTIAASATVAFEHSLTQVRVEISRTPLLESIKSR
jgi:hypothetical protein